MTTLRPAVFAVLCLSLVSCESSIPPTAVPQSPSQRPTATVQATAPHTPSPSLTANSTKSPIPTRTPASTDQSLWIPPGDLLATRHYSIGGLSLTLDGHIRSVPVGAPLLAIDRSTFLLATFDALSGTPTTWRADPDDGNALPIFSGGIAVDVDLERGRLLIASDAGRRIVISDFDGQPIASAVASGAQQSVFLRDGSVCFTSGGSIVVWQPDKDAKTSAVLSSNLAGANLTAIGEYVVANIQDGPGVLIDPRSGTEIGERWLQGYDAAISVNPGGTQFVVGAQDQSAIQPTLQIRDGQTGQIVAAVTGKELSYIESLAWLTDQILLVLRTTTGTGVEPMPELRRADQLDQASSVEPITPWMRILAQKGALFMLGGYRSQVLVLQVSESTGE